ncbi:hypothetical protein BGX21_002660 [Mortierella sp. AD011]|nr:hypothetical protein BGX20_002400 [Mortierella sp. AD010]KAF9379383.1 hypothetical protein BGX21_002660 [Mortierella sp. AD011]
MGIAHAYASATISDTTSYESTYVVLVQTNDYPSSGLNISWSLVGAWEHSVTRYDAYSPQECHVDTTTGIFTSMSNYSNEHYQYPDQLVSPAPPTPEGFQYDPRTNAASSFTLSADYHWGDVDNTFALFTWPNTTLLYLANIADPSNGTINLGMLKKNEDGSSTFVNAGGWTLDPNTYGYPRKLGFGQDSIYQFGSIVANNMTGAFKSLLTRIPLSGPNGTVFSPPTNLPVYEIDNFNNCSYTDSSMRPYRDMLYFICEATDATDTGPVERTYLFKYNTTGVISINPGGTASESRFMSNGFQPISGGGNSSVWVYAPPRWMSLDPNIIGAFKPEDTLALVNITESFESYPKYIRHTDPTTYISIGVSVFVLLVIAIIVWRNWRHVVKFRTQIWPRWKRKIKAKIIDFASRIDDGDDGSKISDADGSLGSGTRYEKSDPTINKIEEMPMQLIDAEEGHKILVTPDMDLSDLDEVTITAASLPPPAVVDVNVGYMMAVNLDTHPRPAVVMTLSDDSILGNGRLDNSSENNLNLLRPDFTVSFALLSSASRNIDVSTEHQKQYTTPSEVKVGDIPSEDTEDYAPPYIHADDLSMLPTPSFPSPAIPSAPPLDTENRNTQSSPGLTDEAITPSYTTK